MYISVDGYAQFETSQDSFSINFYLINFLFFSTIHVLGNILKTE